MTDQEIFAKLTRILRDLLLDDSITGGPSEFLHWKF